jgi:hypothetical protein
MTNDLYGTAQHVTDMPDGSHLVLREDPLTDVHVKLWADVPEVGSTLLGYVVNDPELMTFYAPERRIWVNDPLFVTKARQMYLRTF